MSESECPLCACENAIHFYTDKFRSYLRCPHCCLIYVPSSFHLSEAEEQKVYDQHQNKPEDAGYRNFLSRLMSPLLAALSETGIKPPASGLDFGSGPGPTLSLMLEDASYDMRIYDYYYARHPEVLCQTYDFITSTEVWEHLSQPKQVIDQLFSLLKPKGIIGVMTKRIPDKPFETWHYIKDPTHITFFADKTFEFIAEQYQCELRLQENDVALLIRR
jgi:SAM-dependent methyltransferase